MNRPSTDPRPLAALALASALSCACAPAAASTEGSAPAGLACRAVSGASVPTVVELYTSEGCSSCPPADRWLSSLKGRADVVALAFHVGYWDRLGWADRYALPEGTTRQHEWARRNDSPSVYTPQVLADGRDWRGWPRLPAPQLQPQPQPQSGPVPRLQLDRSGDTVTATVEAAADPAAAGRRIAGYWAVVEDGHSSRVGAGENAGETLRHDHVVRLYRPVAAWSAALPQRLRLEVSAGVAAHPRRVVFVVTDAAGQRPLQALALGC